MTTDNDQAAVEALLRIFDDLHDDGDRATARAILDAIRKGEVPGVYDLAALRDARNAADYNRRCWEGVSAERDRLAGLLRKIVENEPMAAAMRVFDRETCDAALVEVGK